MDGYMWKRTVTITCGNELNYDTTLNVETTSYKKLFMQLFATFICILCENCTIYSDSVSYMWKQTKTVVCGNYLNIV